MAELELVALDESSFDDIPDPAQPGARCQTCDSWERVDGGRDAPEADAIDETRNDNPNTTLELNLRLLMKIPLG